MIDTPDPIPNGQTRREKIQTMKITVTEGLENGTLLKTLLFGILNFHA